MTDRPVHLPHLVGVRLSTQDQAKLNILCRHTQCSPGALVRLLIRTARLVDVVPVRFDAEPSAGVQEP